MSCKKGHLYSAEGAIFSRRCSTNLENSRNISGNLGNSVKIDDTTSIMYYYLFIYLINYLFIYLSIYLFMCLVIYLLTYLFIYYIMYFIYFFIYLCICLFN